LPYRRICPGKFFAAETLFILIATTLAVFKIDKAIDDEGNVVEPLPEYTSGFLRYGTFRTSQLAGARR
jgi:hypothetical protein